MAGKREKPEDILYSNAGPTAHHLECLPEPVEMLYIAEWVPRKQQLWTRV